MWDTGKVGGIIMNELRFCPKCGAKIENAERFCGECGFDTEVLDDFDETIQENDNNTESMGGRTNPQTDEITPNIPLQNTTQKNSSQTAIIIVSVVLGSIFLIGGILFWWFSQGKALVNKPVPSGSEQNQVTLELPSYSLNEGSYTSEQKVEINKPAGEDVQVYFTIDGSDPTAKSSKYESPIVLKTNTTLKSIAIDKNGNQSGIKTGAYTITIQPPATTQPATTQPQTTPPASSEATERAQFDSNINGTWKVVDSSGFVLYYQFSGGRLVVTDGGSDYFNDAYTFSIVPGNNGTIGTVYAGSHTLSIDCNPLGDNAIYIDGSYAVFNQ